MTPEKILETLTNVFTKQQESIMSLSGFIQQKGVKEGRGRKDTN